MATLKNNELTFADGTKPILDKTALSTSTDLDDYTEMGFYVVNGVSHIPSGGGSWYFLLCLGDQQYTIRQVLFACGGNAIYTRQKISGTFQPWQQINLT